MQSLLDALKVIIVSVILTPIAYATSSDLVGSAEATVVQASYRAAANSLGFIAYT